MLARWITDNLQKNMAQVPAVALLGARQVGKTTLAKIIAKRMNSIYLDLEAPEDLLKLSDPTSFLSTQSDKLVILDEIQRTPDLFMVLRGLIDKSREQGRKSGQFFVTWISIYELTTTIFRKPCWAYQVHRNGRAECPRD